MTVKTTTDPKGKTTAAPALGHGCCGVDAAPSLRTKPPIRLLWGMPSSPRRPRGVVVAARETSNRTYGTSNLFGKCHD